MFELKDDKAKVILAMNHFKAKTSGIDKNDGQGGSADRRVMEARECLKYIMSLLLIMKIRMCWFWVI